MQNNFKHVLIEEGILTSFSISKFLNENEILEFMKIMPKDCDSNEKILQFLSMCLQNLDISTIPGSLEKPKLQYNNEFNIRMNLVLNNVYTYLKKMNVNSYEQFVALSNALCYVYQTGTIPFFDFISEINNNNSFGKNLNEDDDLNNDANTVT